MRDETLDHRQFVKAKSRAMLDQGKCTRGWGMTKFCYAAGRSVVSIDFPSARVGATAGLEIRVNASLLSRDASGRIVNEHCIEKVETVLFEAGNQRSRFLSSPFRERGLEVWERRHARPCLLVWSAE